MSLPINPMCGEAVCELGGKERVLRVNLNTIRMMENALGVSFLLDPDDAEGLARLESRIRSIDGVCQAVAAALSNKRRRVDADMVGEWLSQDMSQLPGVVTAIMTAINRFYSGGRDHVDKSEERPTSGPAASPVGPVGQS